MNILYIHFSLSTNIFGFFHKNREENNGYVSPYNEESSSGNKIKMKLKEFDRYHLSSDTAIMVNLLIS